MVKPKMAEKLDSIVQVDPPVSTLPLEQKISVVDTWLKNNSNHPDCDFVEFFLDFKNSEAESKRKDAELEKQKAESKRKDAESKRKDAELEKYRAESEKQKAELEKQKAELEKQKAESKRKDTELGKRSLKRFVQAHTPLHDATASGFYYPKNHNHAEVVLEDISEELLSSIEENFMSEEFLLKGVYSPPEKEYCDSESEALVNVMLLLAGILQGLELNDIIEVALNRTLAGVECDILLIYKPNRFPFAAMEIKKPPSKPEQRMNLWHGKIEEEESDKRTNRVAGEAWAQLQSLQLFGLDDVYGMISTHNQCRLVRKSGNTEEGKTKTEAINIESMKAALNQLRTKKQVGDGTCTFSLPSPATKPVKYEENVIALKQTEKLNQKEPFNRTLYGSQIIPDLVGVENPSKIIRESGKEILLITMLFVLKSCVTLARFFDEKPSLYSIRLKDNMPCRILNDKENHFAFGTWTPSEPFSSRFYPNLNVIYVVHHIGMGDTAHCCLGVSQTGGSACAIKFYHSGKKQEVQTLIHQEFQNWTDIYGKEEYGPPMCRLFKDSADAFVVCLVMAYLKPIPSEKRAELLRDGTIQKVLEEFAERGYKHMDIKWRHLGLWNNKIFLIDLGAVEKFDNGDSSKSAKDKWIDESLEILRQRLGHQTNLFSTPKRTRSVNHVTNSRKKPKTESSLESMGSF